VYGLQRSAFVLLLHVDVIGDEFRHVDFGEASRGFGAVRDSGALELADDFEVICMANAGVDELFVFGEDTEHVESTSQYFTVCKKRADPQMDSALFLLSGVDVDETYFGFSLLSENAEPVGNFDSVLG
jgi:hypothetical protein